MSLRIKEILANKWSVIVALLAIAVAMWILNYYTPIYVDDYWYPYMFVGDSFDINRPITSLKDILISQHYHYFGFNGRSIVHTIVQLFAGILGKSIFNVFNSIAFVGFVYLITRLTAKVDVVNIIFSCVVIFLLYPQFNLTVLWMSGSVNYLWTSIVICLFIILFGYLQMESIQLKHFIWFIPGIIAGWTHEGIAFPLAISIVLFSLVNRKTIAHSAVLPLIIGLVVGALLCAFAPATINRTGIINISISCFFLKIMMGLKVIIKLKALWVLSGTLLILFFVKKTDFHMWLKKFYTDNIILWNTMFLSFAVVFMAVIPEAKTGIGIELPAIILWLRIMYLHKNFFVTIVKILCFVWVGILYVLILYYSIPNYREYKKIIPQIADKTTEVILIKKNSYPFFVNQYILSPIAGLNSDPIGHIYKFVLDLYESNNKIFIPENIYNDILEEDDKISNIHKQGDYPFYVYPLSKDIEEDLEPILLLNPTDYSNLPFYVKPFASKLDRYSVAEVPANTSLCDIVNIGNKKYLLVGRHEAIDNRVKDIILRKKK